MTKETQTLARTLLLALSLAAGSAAIWPSAAYGQDHGKASVRGGAKDAAGKKARLEEIAYRAPDGWREEGSRPNQRLFTAPDSDGAQILLTLGPPFSGEFPAAFERVVTAGVNGATVVKSSDTVPTRSTEGYLVLAKTITTQDKGGKRSTALHLAINYNGRIVLVSLFVPDETALGKRQALFQKFLADLELPKPSAGAQADDPAPVRRKSPAEVARDETARRKPGVVRGDLYNTKGQPFHFPGVKAWVHIWGASANGDRVNFDAPVNAAGHYELAVPHGLYVCTCWAKFPLGDHTVAINLDALDEKPTEVTEDSTPGIVKDFGLKLTGRVLGGNPDSFAGYHGGGLYVTDGVNWKEAIFGALERKYPAGSYVEVTLTPRSRLIDGSAGRPIVLKCDLGRMKSGQTHPNIPLAIYSATARLVTPGGRSHPCKVALLPTLNYDNSVDITFKPREGDMYGRPETPNLFVLD